MFLSFLRIKKNQDMSSILKVRIFPGMWVVETSSSVHSRQSDFKDFVATWAFHL